ncbi:MAG: MaoC/PaaZ C-terminal domain-containing protein [Acidimicrobiales bacterium]
MKLFPERVGVWAEPATQAWGPMDCSMYALAVGAGFSEPHFTLWRPHVPRQSVVPSFPLTLVSADTNGRADPLLGIGEFDENTPIVLGEQQLLLHRPVEPQGVVAINVAITGLYDKGKGAVVTIEARATDPEDGSAAFTAVMSMFIVGAGNFGGDRGPKREPVEWPARPPDRRSTFASSPVQSLLYMHAGKDDHPIHIDTAAARAAGFDGPILTGQNSLGIACHAIVQELCPEKPEAVRSISGHFANPAYNGDVLTTEMWKKRLPERGADIVVFRTVNQNGAVVIDGGRCELDSNQS